MSILDVSLVEARVSSESIRYAGNIDEMRDCVNGRLIRKDY